MSKKKSNRLPLTENEIADKLIEKYHSGQVPGPSLTNEETDKLIADGLVDPPDEMQKLELLPGLFGQVVPDPRWDTQINEGDWPAVFAAAPGVGDLIRSIDGKQVVEVSRRGHAFGPLGPFVILFVKAFKE